MSETIFLATDDGAFRVRDGNAERIGLDGKTLSMIVQQPDDANPVVSGTNGVLHAGAWEDGVYRSTDGGATWVRVLAADVWMLAQRPDRCELLYAGVEPAGVYRSSDYGQTWTELDTIYKLPTYNEWWFPPPPHSAHVTSFVMHPRNVKTIYAGVEVGGIIVSQDGGRTWAELHEGLHDDIHAMACDPSPCAAGRRSLRHRASPSPSPAPNSMSQARGVSRCTPRPPRAFIAVTTKATRGVAPTRGWIATMRMALRGSQAMRSGCCSSPRVGRWHTIRCCFAATTVRPAIDWMAARAGRTR